MNESRAARYQRDRRRSANVAVLCGGVLITIAAFTPVAAMMSAWCLGVTRGFAFPLDRLAATGLFVLLFVLAWEAALLTALGFARANRSPRSAPQPIRRQTIVSQLLATGVAVPCALGIALVIQASVWFAGAWWWLVAGLTVSGALVAVLHALPAFLARITGARPVTRPALVERLGALSRRTRVEVHSIDEVAGESVTATALVAGLGGSRRVFISSDVLSEWSDEEVEVVVAHEFAHHVHHDLLRTLALDAAILAAGFRVAGASLSLFPPAGALSPGSLVALPAIALVVFVMWLCLTPLRHALSRNQERRADRFALEATGAVEQFRAAIRRLAREHLAEERPSRLTRWLYHRHPSAADRLALADAFQSSVSPKP